MPQMKAEPPAPVRSLAELFAIAYALEQEAAERYRALADKMREHGSPSTAAVFDRLAQQECGHGDEITRLSRQQSGKAPNAADIHWHIPETFDDEGIGDVPGQRVVTPHRALSMAVRNEERAFAFWSYIVARTEDETVRKAAEAMAREELEHVSLLRRERRRAYHSAGGKERPARRPTPVDILAEAAKLESQLASQLEDIRAHYSSEAQARLRELAQLSRQMAGSSRPQTVQPTGMHQHSSSNIEDILPTAEYLIECYLEAADSSTDEMALNRAQELAKAAITRLASLRAIAERASSGNS